MLEFTDHPDPDYRSPWLRFAQVALVLCATAYLALGALAGALTATSLVVPPQGAEAVFLGVYMVAMGAVMVGVATVNVVAAWGLGGRRRWAFVAAVLLGFLYAPSGCFPFGIVILWGLLGDGPTRRQFLKK